MRGYYCSLFAPFSSVACMTASISIPIVYRNGVTRKGIQPVKYVFICNFTNFARTIRCLKCKAEGPKKSRGSDIEMKKGDWNYPKTMLPLDGIVLQNSVGKFFSKLQRSPSRRTKSRWESLPEEKLVEKSASVNHSTLKYSGWAHANEMDKKRNRLLDKGNGSCSLLTLVDTWKKETHEKDVTSEIENDT